MNFSSSFGLNNFDGRNGFAIETVYGEGSGYSVDIAGDINNDGIDDLIIGAPFASPNGELSGKSYVVFGDATIGSATVKLSDLNGRNGFVINGVEASSNDGDVFTLGDRAGSGVSRAGDVNGDGVDDILITSNGGLSTAIGGQGKVAVVFGRQAGFDASLELSELDGSNGFTIIAEAGENGVRLTSIREAGDVNGDGIGDIIIGAPSNGNVLDKSYVVFGSTEPTPTLNLLNLDTSGRDRR